MYTIFINDAVVYLTDDYELKDKMNFFIYSEVDLQSTLIRLESSTLKSLYLYDKSLLALWANFKSQFKIIEASGGVVYNEHKEVLWIFRNDRWDLPKGKIEKGESKEIAAVREVEEECGIRNVTLKKYLNTTYHIYRYKEHRVLKISYWYTMHAYDQLLTPQIEEGITKVAWLNVNAQKKALKDTYGTIRLLFNDTKLKSACE